MWLCLCAIGLRNLSGCRCVCVFGKDDSREQITITCHHARGCTTRKRVRCHSWEYSPAILQGNLQEKSNEGSNQLGRFVRMLVSSLPESGFLHCPVPKPADNRWKLTMPLFYLVIPFWWVPPARFAFFTWCYNLQHFQSRQTHKVRVAEPPGRFYAYARHTLIFYRGV